MHIFCSSLTIPSSLNSPDQDSCTIYYTSTIKLSQYIKVIMPCKKTQPFHHICAHYAYNISHAQDCPQNEYNIPKVEQISTLLAIITLPWCIICCIVSGIASLFRSAPASASSSWKSSSLHYDTTYNLTA